MILVTGEILFDLFGDRRQMGGAPFNFAFHLKKLGLAVRFFSRVGNDDLGREILDFLALHNFDTQDIQIDPNRPTGTVVVTPGRDGHTFKITPETAWDSIAFTPRLKACLEQGPDMVYFGSLVQRTGQGRSLIGRIMDWKPAGTRVFCDINLRPESYTEAVIHACVSAADVVKLNREELEQISGTDRLSPEAAGRRLIGEHGLQMVMVTLGAEGSTWITRETTLHTPAASPEKIIDTVGAGDAYAAVSAACLNRHLSLDTGMALASAFAAHICAQEGALPKDDAVYQPIKQRIMNHGTA